MSDNIPRSFVRLLFLIPCNIFRQTKKYFNDDICICCVKNKLSFYLKKLICLLAKGIKKLSWHDPFTEVIWILRWSAITISYFFWFKKFVLRHKNLVTRFFVFLVEDFWKVELTVGKESKRWLKELEAFNCSAIQLGLSFLNALWEFPLNLENQKPNRKNLMISPDQYAYKLNYRLFINKFSTNFFPSCLISIIIEKNRKPNYINEWFKIN